MANDVKTRDQVALKDTWRLEDIFENDSQWEAEFIVAQGAVGELPGFQGKLADDDAAAAALRARAGAMYKVERLYSYARMRKDSDNANTTYQALADRAMALYVSLETAASFMDPELLEKGEAGLSALAAREDMKDFGVYIRKLIRRRPHTLSAPEERLVAMTGEMAQTTDNVYTMLGDVDMKFGKITDSEGNEVELTHGRYIPLMMGGDRRVRKDAFTALYTTYKSYENTLAALYGGSVKADIFYSRAARFDSTRQAKLFSNAVPESVYDNLLRVAHEYLPVLGRYYDLKRRQLGLDTMQMWDVYAETIQGFEMKLPYEEAYALVIECLEPLGEEYLSVLKEARDQRWIDVYETAGKTSGAYCSGVYGVHPYVLLNHEPNIEAALTIAHEMGHAMHSWYSNKTQPYPCADYSIFAAEVASTVNEVLMTRALLKKHPQKEAQAFFLGNILEQFRSTLFRQTMFAEFEHEAHRMAESGEALTVEALCGLYGRLNAQYLPGVAQDELIPYEWMRIPHFYSSYYVFQYATGYAAATAIAQRIINEGAPAVEDYKRFLSAGGSMDPIDALRLAGIDMASPAPVRSALEVFKEVLENCEKLAEV